MQTPNKPVKLVARENLIALLNRMKRFYEKAAANWGALAEKIQTASDDNVAHVERELLDAFRLASLALKNLQAEVAKVLNQRAQFARDGKHLKTVEKDKTLLKMYERMTADQIATEEGVKRSTAEKRIQRAKNRMKNRRRTTTKRRSVRASGFNKK
jgi:DNA-directed RNA polymerase specialized sigma24 family protein